MVEIKDIVDRDTLFRWLEQQPRKVSVSVSARAALRFLPHYLEYLLTAEEREGVSPIPALLPSLISQVAIRSRGLILSEQLEKVARKADTVATEKLGFDPAVRYAYSFALVDANSGALDTSEAADAIYAWREIRNDCESHALGRDLIHLPLWQYHDVLGASKWEKSKRLLSDDRVNWSFWIKWYEAALTGEPLNYEMLERIALIPSDDWEQGPKHVNGLIAAIEAEFEAPQASTNYTKSIQQAVAQNKEGIAPQIEALTEILSAEIERLRCKNPADDIEQEENKRLSAIFEGLQVAIVRLGALIPNSGEPSQDVAEEMEGLLKVYAGEFRKWPRENAADMVDSTIRAALVGLTAGVIVAFGAPVLLGVAVGGITFGGKKLAGAAKALKDSSSDGN